jgi:hypothetical protein
VEDHEGNRDAATAVAPEMSRKRQPKSERGCEATFGQDRQLGPSNKQTHHSARGCRAPLIRIMPSICADVPIVPSDGGDRWHSRPNLRCRCREIARGRGGRPVNLSSEPQPTLREVHKGELPHRVGHRVCRLDVSNRPHSEFIASHLTPGFMATTRWRCSENRILGTPGLRVDGGLRAARGPSQTAGTAPQG